MSDASARDRFERLHHEIRNRICLLDYAPGSRLSETALAEEFGVSRTPLRRVLVRLECEGLLRSVQGVGTIVTDADINELEQTYRLRMELAGLAGRLSPTRPSAELVAEFRDLAERARSLTDAPEPRRFAELNMAFFQALLKITDNLALREVSERLYFQTTRIWLQSVFASIIDLNEEIRIFGGEVEEILAAVELGDMEAVALIQRAHISMSFTRMRSAARAVGVHETRAG
jgi:DNA-binding GntR family transcriptional regulator